MADYFEDPAVCKWTERSTYSGRLADHMNQLLSAGKFNFAPGDVTWVDELADPWGPTGRYGRCYGRSPLMDAQPDFDAVRSLHRTLFNTEGEKPMAEIDWKKPLRAYPHGERNKHQKVYTFKSGKQRVVWIDDHVYPVDDDGRATASIQYTGRTPCRPGDKIVENVPEEKFFVGLARDPDGTYWLTDGGAVSDMGTMNYWKKLMGDQPHWIVDTRKPAEPPKAIAHDPKDWTVVIGWGASTTSYGMRTEADARAVAEKHAGEGGDVKVVRVRETPAPADTARYIQLYRLTPGVGPWSIDKRRINGGNPQEYRGENTSENGCRGIEYVHVKVRD